jgi:aspartate racemase
MKVIGLIGGMSWESSLDYYKIINQTVRTELGGQHSAKILMYSVDFDEIERLQHEDRWDETVNILIDAGRRVENGGADLVLLCTNTMHKVADELQGSLNIPLVHIVDAAAEEINRAGISVVGLLGTRFTMEQEFYKDRLSSKHGLQVIIPGERSRNAVHAIIYDELCQGKIIEQSKRTLLQIISELESDGAQGVILGCTELPMLIGPDDSRIPLFDTTGIHARKAVALALGEGMVG